MRFEDCAHTYDAHAAPQRAFAERVAGFIEAHPGEEVLELGAGTGALTRHLCARAGGSVRATDISPAMLAQGREAVPQAQWFQLDAFGAAVPASALQVSSGLLQWAAEPLEVLRRWKTALRPGGRMVHAFPCEPCLSEWRTLVPTAPLQWRDEPAWAALFAQAGLRVRRRQLWVDQVTFPSALELVRAFHRTGVTSHVRLGAGRLRAALRAYEERYGVAGGVVATWAWLAVEAY